MARLLLNKLVVGLLVGFLVGFLLSAQLFIPRNPASVVTSPAEVVIPDAPSPQQPSGPRPVPAPPQDKSNGGWPTRPSFPGM